MKLSQHARVLVQSLQPNKHRLISERLLSQTFGTYAITFLIGFILMIMLSLPVASQRVASFEDVIDNLAVATLDIKIETTEPVIISSFPKIILDTTATENADAFLTLGKDQYWYKKYYFFGETSRLYSHSADLKAEDTTLRDFLKALLWLLIPGFLLLFAVLILIVSLLFNLLFSLIGTFFVKKISYRDLFVISTHVQLVPLLIFMIALPFISLFWFVFILYVILFGLGLVLLNGYEFKSSASK